MDGRTAQVHDSYHAFEKRKTLVQADFPQALEFAKVNLARRCGDRGDEHPMYIDVELVQDALDRLDRFKRTQQRRDGRATLTEWEDCFREASLRRGVC